VESQNLELDSLHLNFESCVLHYLVNKYPEKDTIYAMYGEKVYPYLEVKYSDKKQYLLTEKKRDSTKTNIIDSTYTGLYNNWDYIQMYLDDVIRNYERKKCFSLHFQNGLIMPFINCSSESWIQFHTDILLDRTPHIYFTIDVISVNDDKVFYERELIICSYTVETGFVIKMIEKIGGNKFICDIKD